MVVSRRILGHSAYKVGWRVGERSAVGSARFACTESCAKNVYFQCTKWARAGARRVVPSHALACRLLFLLANACGAREAQRTQGADFN